MKHFVLFSLFIALVSIAANTNAQTTAKTSETAALLASTEAAMTTAGELLKLQESEVTKLTSSLEQLRQLFNQGLIARVELEEAEQGLATAKASVETTRNHIASAEKLAAEIKKSEEQARIKPLVKPTLMAINRPGTVTRSTVGSWSLSQLSNVQQFFSQTFGRALPTSTIGQSATHNRLGWDHRNSVDVGIHPDTAEGRALMSYLESSGIPFLAFRSAVPGVSTGPHIHIGYPSHRLG